MPLAKRALLSALCTLALSACATVSKSPAGTPQADTHVRKGVDDPRARHLACLRSDKIPYVEVGQVGLRVGTPPFDARIVFTPSPGSAQQYQISGASPGAEVIGSALLYPQRDSDAQLSAIEGCLTIGVKG